MAKDFTTTEFDLQAYSLDEIQEMCGSHDTKLKQLEKQLGIQIANRSSHLLLKGNQESLDQASKNLHQLAKNPQTFEPPPRAKKLQIAKNYSVSLDNHTSQKHKPPADPKTQGQKDYCEALRNNLCTFAIGPPGSGKTFLAVNFALELLHQRAVEKIILTRPIVEAGEKLGYLPGDIFSKVDPYIRPLWDSLNSLLGNEQTQNLLPQASSRNRTFSLHERQNLHQFLRDFRRSPKHQP